MSPNLLQYTAQAIIVTLGLGRPRIILFILFISYIENSTFDTCFDKGIPPFFAFFEFFQNDDLEEEEEESPLGRKLMTVTLGEFQKCLKPACQAEVQVA